MLVFGSAIAATIFVLHLSELPDNYIMLSRFVITCCAVDAYPIGIPVKLNSSRSNYPVDSWLTVEGVAIAETLPIRAGARRQRECAVGSPEAIDRIETNTITKKRSVAIEARSSETIPTPVDPYSYR